MGGELAGLIAEYGYLAAFAGTLAEGESFLLLAGVAANRGYLSLPLLVAVGTGGAILSDNFFFVVGRTLGPALLERSPLVGRSAARAHAIVARRPIASVVGIRFLYGMRSVGPAIIGAGSMPWVQYVALDAVAAALWSSCWTGVGYGLGEAVLRLAERFDRAGVLPILGLAVATSIAVLLFRRWRRTTATRRPPADRPETR